MSRPDCFGTPDRIPACAGCGVRADCWEYQLAQSAVFLLPVDRPVVKVDPTLGSRYVHERDPVALRKWREKHGKKENSKQG